MPTPIFVCGAECGIAVVGTLSAGVEHWGQANGTPTVVTSGPAPMRSARCFKFDPTASIENLSHTFAVAIASPATIVARIYVYFDTLPSADTRIWSANTVVSVVFKQSDSTLRAGGAAASNQAASGFAITAGVWYLLDIKGVRNTTITCDLSVNGIVQAQYSVAGAAATITAWTHGIHDSCTAVMYTDDIATSGTSGDYPIGPGVVAGLYPNGDLTNSAANPTDGNGGHLYSAVNDFGKGAGGATNLAAQNVESTSWQSLAKPLSSSVATNFLAGINGTSAERLTHTFEQLPANAVTVQGAMVVAATHSATTTANNFHFFILRSDFAVNFGEIDADLSETTITLPCAVSAQAMTVADINGIRSFFLSSDVTPDVYLDGACLEVAYTEVVGPLQAAKARRRQ